MYVASLGRRRLLSVLHALVTVSASLCNSNNTASTTCISSITNKEQRLQGGGTGPQTASNEHMVNTMSWLTPIQLLSQQGIYKHKAIWLHIQFFMCVYVQLIHHSIYIAEVRLNRKFCVGIHTQGHRHEAPVCHSNPMMPFPSHVLHSLQQFQLICAFWNNRNYNYNYTTFAMNLLLTQSV